MRGFLSFEKYWGLPLVLPARRRNIRFRFVFLDENGFGGSGKATKKHPISAKRKSGAKASYNAVTRICFEMDATLSGRGGLVPASRQAAVPKAQARVRQAMPSRPSA
jgi:hypothetical protein